MLSKYPSIPNLLKRDPETHEILPGFSHPVFEYLFDCKWHTAAKLDGTNIRIEFDEKGDFTVKGRTDRANLKPALVEAISAQMEPYRGFWTNQTIVGEGTGPGIQKGWERYGNEYKFTAFDIVWDDGRYADKEETFSSLEEAGIPTPEWSFMTLREATELVYNGLGSYPAPHEYEEGLVCTAMIPWHVGDRQPVVKVKHRYIFQNEAAHTLI